MAKSKSIQTKKEVTYPELPSDFFMDPVKWKFMVRAASRGKNLLIVGHSGCGKTSSVYKLAEVLGRKLYKFNMGATQDARSELIGNIHFDKDTGTYVAESEFLTAIQTPGSIVLLDEISRAHPDAWNILMTVIDPMQRYVRVSEKPGSPVVQVADGVSFMLTANVGSEYTGTKTLDRALLDRCQLLEVDVLDADAELELLAIRNPSVDRGELQYISRIASDLRNEFLKDDSRVDTIMSTRMSLETAELVADGFTVEEAAQVCIFPFYSALGGNESPRSFVKKVVQKYLGDDDSFGEKSTLPWA